MPPIFSEIDKVKIRKRLLEIGLSVIKTKGFKKMSIDEVVKECGIAKGTFYHFFESKQMFIVEMITDCRERNLTKFQKELEQKGELEVDQLLEWYKDLQTDSENPLNYMTTADAQWMKESLPKEYIYNENLDIEIARRLTGKLRGAREDIDYAFVANIPKIILLAIAHKDEMHEEVLDKNIEMILLMLKQYLNGTINI